MQYSGPLAYTLGIVTGHMQVDCVWACRSHCPRKANGLYNFDKCCYPVSLDQFCRPLSKQLQPENQAIKAIKTSNKSYKQNFVLDLFQFQSWSLISQIMLTIHLNLILRHLWSTNQRCWRLNARSLRILSSSSWRLRLGWKKKERSSSKSYC